MGADLNRSSNPSSFPTPESWSKNVNPGFRAPSDDSESEDDHPSKVSSGRTGLTLEVDTPLSSSIDDISSDKSKKTVPPVTPPPAKPGALAQVDALCEPLPTSQEAQESEISVPQVEPKTSKIEVFDLTHIDDEPCRVKSKRDGLGSSQTNPIELEPLELKAKYDTISDSDEEGPEALPIRQELLGLPSASIKTTPHNTANEFAQVFDCQTLHRISHYAETKERKQIAAESTVADSDMGDLDSDDSFSASDEDVYFETEDELDHKEANHRYSSSLMPQDEETSNDDEENESEAQSVDHRVIAHDQVPNAGGNLEEKVDRGIRTQCNIKGNVSTLRANVLVKDSQTDAPLRQSTSFTSEVLDISQNTLNCPVWSGTIHRAPSPSDAALAKVPTATLTRPSHEDLFNRMRAEEEEKYKTASIWAQYGKENPVFPPAANNSTVAPHGKLQDVISNAYTFGTCAPDFLYTCHDSTSLPRYDDGPFAPWPRYNLSPAPQPPLNMSTRHYNDDARHSDFRVDCSPYGQPYWRHNIETSKEGISQEISYLPPADMSILKAQDPRANTHELGENLEKRDSKLSRVPISDIVNDASGFIPSPLRTLKRKADAITSDALDVHHASLQTQAPSGSCAMYPVLHSTENPTNSEEWSEELSLPDAQPRDGDELVEIFSNESLAQSSSTSDGIATSDAAEGPAKKKVKIAKGSRKPVQTFISGMLAGGISVFGALLMYGATAPVHLQDQVRLEFQ